MRIQAFLQEVIFHIRATEARRFVKLELENHLQSVVAENQKKGMSKEEAEKQAILQMGEADLLGKKMNKLHKPKIDWFLLLGFMALISLSFLPMIYLQDTSQMNMLLRKSVYTVFGLVVVVGFMFYDYRKLLKYGYLFLAIGLVLLILINNSSFLVNGSPYLYIGGFSIEASYSLPFFVLAWASILNKSKIKGKIDVGGIKALVRIEQTWWKLLLLYIVTILLLYPTGNHFLLLQYTSLVVVMVLFSSKEKRERIIVVASISLFAIGSIVITYIKYPYVAERWNAFLKPDSYANTSGYLILKAKEYIGQAGWFGQKFPLDGFIPEAHTDLIFITITYGYGWFLGGLLVVLLVGLSVRMISIFRNLKDPFARLLTIGAVTLYSISFCWSILMSLGLLPLVGVSLPFFSYGFMPIILHSFLIGIVLSAYRRKNLISFSPTKM